MFGAELSLGLTGRRTACADPEGSHLLVLARGRRGITGWPARSREAQLAGGEKGRPVYDLEELAERPAGPLG